MRKLIWGCSIAGVLASGSFLSLAYYACRCPDSRVGRSMQVIAEASLAMQPLSGLASLALHVNQAAPPAQEASGSAEECVPDDPQPVEPDTPVNRVGAQVIQKEQGFASGYAPPAEAVPIVIAEEDPMPSTATLEPLPAANNVASAAGQEMLTNGCPVVMPYCQDDGEGPITPPVMPLADEDKPACTSAKKTDDSSEASENAEFEEWRKLFDQDEHEKSPAGEELPVPTEDGKKGSFIPWQMGLKTKPRKAEQLPAPKEEEEEPQDEPKCQEDSHLHEHYSGCPSVTCPYTGKSYPACEPANKAGSEESSEEPPTQDSKLHHHKSRKGKDECPRTQGVDTMEYRSSDAGLDEYGPGPMQ